MRLFLATRAFFAVLFQKSKAEGVKRILDQRESLLKLDAPSSDSQASLGGPPKPTVTDTSSSKPPTAKPQPAKPARSEALTLLSTLQREARLLDLVQEPLDAYSDAQIGAAARDVLRDTKKCMARLFDIQPLVESEEGDTVTLPESHSPVRWKVVGNASNRGTLVHRGWQATKVELPTWSGKSEDALVVAAAELET